MGVWSSVSARLVVITDSPALVFRERRRPRCTFVEISVWRYGTLEFAEDWQTSVDRDH